MFTASWLDSELLRHRPTNCCGHEGEVPRRWRKGNDRQSATVRGFTVTWLSCSAVTPWTVTPERSKLRVRYNRRGLVHWGNVLNKSTGAWPKWAFLFQPWYMDGGVWTVPLAHVYMGMINSPWAESGPPGYRRAFIHQVQLPRHNRLHIVAVNSEGDIGGRGLVL